MTLKGNFSRKEYRTRRINSTRFSFTSIKGNGLTLGHDLSYQKLKNIAKIDDKITKDGASQHVFLSSLDAWAGRKQENPQSHVTKDPQQSEPTSPPPHPTQPSRGSNPILTYKQRGANSIQKPFLRSQFKVQKKKKTS